MLSDIYLAGGSYTPMGTFNGFYAEAPADLLGAVAVKKALERARVSPADVDEIYFGNVISAGLGQNIARQVGLKAGLPISCGATAVNKMCGSGMRAIALAAHTVQSGEADLIVAGGTENMTRAPYLLPKGRTGYRLGHGQVIDAMIRDGLSDAYSGKHMGEYAEAFARQHGFSREMQDDFGIASFQRAIAAQADGVLADVYAPVEIPGKTGPVLCDRDEEPAKFNEAKFRTLKPVFAPDGSITAGNASAISDGAAAMVVVRQAKARALGIPLQARLLGHVTASLEPENYTIAPVHALKKLSERLSIRLSDVDLFEINEAFAPVVMAAMRECNLPHEKVNVFGGAIAIGHPIGASGARIVASLMNALRVKRKKLGVACLCIGGGEASAVAIELV